MGEFGKPCIGKFIDFSRFGAAFSLKRPFPVFRTSQTLSEFNIIIGDECAFKGNATIVNMRMRSGKLNIGVSLESNLIDTEKVFALGHKTFLTHQMSKKILSFKPSSKLNKNFKSEVADLRYYLENHQKEFEKQEKNIRIETNLNKIFLEQSLLAPAINYSTPIIHASMRKIGSIVKDFNKDLDNIHKEYFRMHLHHLFLESPFIKRAYLKPLGYAGDYEMMNMLYQDPIDGKTLFGKFMNYNICQSPAAQAVRNRIPFLINKIEQLVKNKLPTMKRDKISITSVGCGPAKEIQDFLIRNEDSNHCEITLLDMDKYALQHCQERILEIKASKNRKTKINFLQKSITEIIRDQNNLNFKNQDIIYSVGLFDYLITDTASKLIQIFSRCLGPNGILIIGNFDPSNETKNYLEYVMEWYLIHRNDREMEDLARFLSQNWHFSVRKESTKINNFLIVKKD